MDTIIRMKHVSKSYQLGLKSIQALKNLDFTADGSQVLLGGVERLFAMTLHVGFSFLIFKGVEEKKARWWLLAVLLHGLTDFQLVIGNLAVVEGLLLLKPWWCYYW